MLLATGRQTYKRLLKISVCPRGVFMNSIIVVRLQLIRQHIGGRDTLTGGGSTSPHAPRLLHL
eukprot:6807031-Pyramimonas_sp.AAC.1